MMTVEDKHIQLTAEALDNLVAFRADQKLQQAAIAYVVDQFASPEEKENLRIAFNVLDENNEGTVSAEELMRGYEKIYGKNLAESEV